MNISTIIDDGKKNKDCDILMCFIDCECVKLFLFHSWVDAIFPADLHIAALLGVWCKRLRIWEFIIYLYQIWPERILCIYRQFGPEHLSTHRHYI